MKAIWTAERADPTGETALPERLGMARGKG